MEIMVLEEPYESTKSSSNTLSNSMSLSSSRDENMKGEQTSGNNSPHSVTEPDKGSAVLKNVMISRKLTLHNYY